MVRSVFLPVLIFCLAGSGLTVLNKILVSQFFPLPSFLTLIQCSFTAASILLGKYSVPNYFMVENIIFEKCISWSPLVMLFLAMLISSMLALQKVTVTTLIVVRNLTTLTTAICEVHFLNLKFTANQVQLLSLMFFGACLYGSNDISFDWCGYLYLLMNCLATTAYQIRVKVLVAELKMSPLTMSYYNNILSVPVLLILSALQGEISPSIFATISRSHTSFLVFLSCVFGFILSTTAFRLNQLISATSIMVINNANKFLLMIYSEAVLGKSLDLLSGIGCFIVIASSIAYSRSNRCHIVNVESTTKKMIKIFCTVLIAMCTFVTMINSSLNLKVLQKMKENTFSGQISSQQTSEAGKMRNIAHHGILIVKDEGELLRKWLQTHARDFDSIVCVDGSESNETQTMLRDYEKIDYYHESELTLRQYTDTEIRQSALDILSSKYGHGFWVTMAHCDEFYYHDPRKIVQLAEEEHVDGVFWFALHVLPHPSEFETYKANPWLPATSLFHHYHYYGEKGGFRDFRSFKHSPQVHFGRKWSVMLPEGLNNVWSKHPAYLHYKVKQINPNNYDSAGHHLKNFAQARKHGSQNKNGELIATGLSWPINTEKDFFVTSYRGKPKYKKCRRFDGNLPPELNEFPNWTRHDSILPVED